MLRRRLAFLKSMGLALFGIAALLSLAELGLRVHHSFQLQRSESANTEAGLTCPSWTTHHSLKPLKSTVWPNPDTRLPIAIRTNSYGLRGDVIEVPKPSSTYRVLYLGDDTVFGAEVAETETFCQLLAQQLGTATSRKVEVVNAGLPGYCPLLSLLQYRHGLASLAPDLIVLNFDMSDVADDFHYRRHTRIDASQTPLQCPHPKFQLESPKKDSPWSSLLIAETLKQQLGRVLGEDQESELQQIETTLGRYAWTREAMPHWETYITQSLEPVAQLHTIAKYESCPLLVTISPTPWQVSPRAMPVTEARGRYGIPVNKDYPPELATKSVIEFLRVNRIPYCDLCPKFRQAPHPEKLFLETMPRLSRLGHRMISNVVAESVQGLMRDPFDLRESGSLSLLPNENLRVGLEAADAYNSSTPTNPVLRN